MTNSNITYQLSRRVSNIRIQDLGNDQIVDIKYKLLDWFGCAIGAASRPVGKKIINIFNNIGNNDDSSFIGSNQKLHYSNAAYANGMLGHVLELDDVHKSSISHPGAIAIPSALATAEAFNSNIEDFLMGIVAGYEVMIRLGDALNPSHYDYWHTTGTCGAFASAAASSRVRNFSSVETNAALNMVSTTASGLVSVFGTDSKLVTVGHACYAGTMSSMFVKEGLSTTDNILEAENGYIAATSNDDNLNRITENLENRLMIDTAFYKIHASCGHTHSSIDGVLSILAEENVDINQITKVEIRTYDKAIELTGQLNVESEQKAKFSLPYCIACALVYGRVSLSEFKDKVLKSDQIRLLSDKIQISNDDECNSLYPNKRMAKVKIYFGEKFFERKIPLPFGKPPKKFIEDKFMSLATMAISEKNAEQVMKYILSINQMKKMNEFSDIFNYTL